MTQKRRPRRNPKTEAIQQTQAEVIQTEIVKSPAKITVTTEIETEIDVVESIYQLGKLIGFWR